MNSKKAELPPEFAQLTEFLAYWDVPTIEERIDRRMTADMKDIRRFYDVGIGCAESALVYLDHFDPKSLPSDAACLYRLLLALIQAAIAVELHAQPRASAAAYPDALRLLSGRT